MVGKPNPDRVQDDFYQTPAECTRALFENEPFFGSMWEPACGAGAISEVAKNYRVSPIISTDLVFRDYGHGGCDFLEPLPRSVSDLEGIDPAINVNNIVTNPPYSLANKFVLRALSIAKAKVAMFMRLAYLEGDWRRRNLFTPFPPSKIYVMSDRPDMPGIPKYYTYCWIVWDTEALRFNAVREATGFGHAVTDVKWLYSKDYL